MKINRHLVLSMAAFAGSIFLAQDASAQVLDLERWATSEGAWPTYNYWLAGDFSGHKNYYGTTAKDLVMVWADNGLINIDVHDSEIDEGGPGKGPHSFGLYRGATDQGAYPQYVQWVAGDFNHDGFTDVADAWADNGNINIDVHENDNGGPFTLRRYATAQGGWAGEGIFIAGDFDNDSWDDIAYVWNDNGSIDIDVHVNNHDKANPGFTLQRWATGQGGWIEGSTALAGNFDTQPGADIAYAWVGQNCRRCGIYDYVDLHLSKGSAAAGGFAGPNRWTSTPFGVEESYTFTSGDMDHNGFDDVTVNFGMSTNDTVVINESVWESVGTGFFQAEPSVYSTNQGTLPTTVQFVGADFDGDGYGDVADPWENAGTINIDVHRH